MNQKSNICLFLLCHAFLATAQHLEFGFQLNRLNFINPAPPITPPIVNGQYTYNNTVQNREVGLDYIPAVTAGYAYPIRTSQLQSFDIQVNATFGIKGQVQYFQLPVQIFYRKGNCILNKNSTTRNGFGIGLGASYQRFFYQNRGYYYQNKIIPQVSLEFSLLKTIFQFSTFIIPTKTVLLTPYHYMGFSILRTL
jgi:hypothetical protein